VRGGRSAPAAALSDRERHLVELVDATGVATGSCTVEEAHRRPGRTHRAFSVLLVDGSGRLLLQRRAAVKTRFALRWANACCGHPAPDEDVMAAAGRRLAEELGLPAVPMVEVGVHTYRAEDPPTGRVEDEYDHVLFGLVPADVPVRADPAEVAEVRWASPDRLAADLRADPGSYVPWLPGVVAVWRATASARLSAR
jgi:isopentenyl-diphosphate delta-isomerase